MSVQPVSNHVSMEVTDGCNAYIATGRSRLDARKISFYNKGILVHGERSTQNIHGLATNGTTMYAHTFSAVAAFHPHGRLKWECDFKTQIKDIMTAGEDLYVLFTGLSGHTRLGGRNLVIVRDGRTIELAEKLPIYDPWIHSVQGTTLRLLQGSISNDKLVTMEHGVCIAVLDLTKQKVYPSSPLTLLNGLMYTGAGGMNPQDHNDILVTDGKTILDHIPNVGKHIQALCNDGKNIFVTVHRYRDKGQYTHVVVLHPDGTRSAFRDNDVCSVAAHDGLVYLTKRAQDKKCIGVFKAEDF